MADFSIRIEDHSEEFLRKLAAKIPVALEECSLAAEGFAKKEITKVVYDTPESPSYKRTGNLRNSITHTVVDNAAYVGTDMEYAPYVELGTIRMRPRPFIKPSLANYIDQYKQILERRLKG